MNHNTRAVGWKNGEPGVLPRGLKQSLPRPFWGVVSWCYSVFFIVFLEVFMVSAQGRFGIGAFCFKTKDTSHSRGYEREKHKCLVKTPIKKTQCYASTNISFFWRPKETKALFFLQGSRRNPTAHKNQKHRAAFYWNVKQCPFPNAQGLLSPFV